MILTIPISLIIIQLISFLIGYVKLRERMITVETILRMHLNEHDIETKKNKR
jgi:hypothetical protein